MKKYLFFLLFALSICISVSAQKNEIHFHSINSFALIGGENDFSTAFQTVNGVRFLNWFSGIGIGVDYYRYRTLPLFLDVRRYFGSEKKFFVYGDIGYTFPMNTKAEKEMRYNVNYPTKGGIYTELVIGFKTKFIKKSSILFSLSHSYKQLKIRNYIFIPCDLCSYYYNYKLEDYGRILLKTSVEF